MCIQAPQHFLIRSRRAGPASWALATTKRLSLLKMYILTTIKTIVYFDYCIPFTVEK